MAYMRGEYYIWTDANDLHIWSAGGHDGWDRSGWHMLEDGEVRPNHKKSGQNVASGVCIPQEVADEYVVMRLAQLIKEGTLGETIDRAIDPNGRCDTFGARFLTQYAEAIKSAFSEIKALAR